MSLSTTQNKVQFIGNGSTTAFTFPYRFIETSHVVVTLTNISTGVNTLQALGIDYTLIGANTPSGGTVTFFNAPDTNTRVTIERLVPITQEVDYQPDDDFPSEVHETALDKLTMIDQQLESKLGRTLNAPSTDTVSLNPLPNATARANRTLVFDASGQPTASLDNYTNNATNAAASAAAAAASAVSAASSATDAQTAYTNFQGKYIGGFLTDPVVDSLGNPIVAGAVYFNTSLNEIRIYNGTIWTALAPSVNFTARRYVYFATGPAQVTLTGADQNGQVLAYSPGHIDVYLNGVKLNGGSITATNGTSITFPANTFTAGDWIEIVAYTVATIIDVGNGTITDVKLANNSVTTPKIVDNNVTSAKLADVAGITAGAYTTPNISINSKGQITAITSSVQLSTTAAKLITNLEGEIGYYNAQQTNFFVDSNGFLRTAGGNYWQKGVGSVDLLSESGGWQTVYLPFTEAGETISQIHCSYRDVFVLSSAGLLYAAGYNEEGTCGVNVAAGTPVSVFTKLTTFTTADPVVYFSTDHGLNVGHHSAAVTQSGKLYTWGYNGNGQLGIAGDTTRRIVPTLITGGAISGKTIKKCFCFGAYPGRIFVTDSDDNVYCVGYNTQGQLGLGDTVNRTNGFVQVTGINGSKADRIYGTSGRNDYPRSSTWILRNGQLFGTGSNTNRFLGVGDSTDKSSFVQVINLTGKTVVDFACSSMWTNGGGSAAALCSDGTIVNWGLDGVGQLGRGSGAGTGDKDPAAPLSATDGQTTFTKIQFCGAAANISFTALGTNKKLYATGYGAQGVLGYGSTGNVSRLQPVLIPETIADFSYGPNEGGTEGSILARTESGRLYAWGYNRNHCLGLPSQINRQHTLPMPSLIGY